MNKFFALVLGLLFLVSGCASTVKYQEKMDTWKGKNIQEILAKWGDADAAVHLPNNHIEYMFVRKHFYTAPLPASTPALTSMVNGKPIYNTFMTNSIPQGNTQTRYCRTWFETDSSGIILNVRFQGDNCVAAIAAK